MESYAAALQELNGTKLGISQITHTNRNPCSQVKGHSHLRKQGGKRDQQGGNVNRKCPSPHRAQVKGGAVCGSQGGRGETQS